MARDSSLTDTDASRGFVRACLCDVFAEASQTAKSQREPAVRLIAPTRTQKAAILILFYPELEIPLLTLHSAMQYDSESHDAECREAAMYYRALLASFTGSLIPYLPREVAERTRSFLGAVHLGILKGETYELAYRTHSLASQIQAHMIEINKEVAAFHLRTYLCEGRTSLDYMSTLRRRTSRVTVHPVAKQITHAVIAALPQTRPPEWSSNKAIFGQKMRHERRIGSGANVVQLAKP